MKKAKLIFNSLWALAMVATVSFLISCGGDEEAAVELTIVSLNAGDDDLNGATSPDGVSVSSVISGIFSTDLDPASAASNITLVNDFDDSEVDINVVASGRALTITPAEPLFGGSLYVLTLKAGLSSTKGKTLGADITRTFTTVGSFTPQNVIAHWTFEDNADDQVGDFDADAEIAITYTDSRNAAAGKAATFDGDVSIIEVPGAAELMNRADFTLSYWAKTNSEGHVNETGDPTGHFVMGLGAFHGFQTEITGSYRDFKVASTMEYGDGTTGTGGDLVWNGDGKTKDNEGWKGTVFSKADGDLTASLKDKWVHVTFVFSGTEKYRELYINGDLKKRQEFELWGSEYKEPTAVGLKFDNSAEVENVLAFGFVQSRGGTLWSNEPWGNYNLPTSQHFKGKLDDVRIFSVAVTAEEIKKMYDSEKP
ncbi:Ig-like domain-containing protein [Imperialibacter roseus]|uniref:Ig-like domain-containing protein n=1 Tax=Imperialibacter roseus TaxID=1324217 RepID=A0ABZ0IQ17_9BACT|nr:Ig-like domain-containing protein [Imperialibacter roseus]WOK07143.1 Ig-like domain-containing protein [Imperialibacter roseus]|tara:strand:- start:8097 stop:9368 length:1272 start_codon:yes stop_codon:yes gene_type:complete